VIADEAEYATGKAIEDGVTCFFYFAQSLCDTSDAVQPFVAQLADHVDNEKVNFVLCDVTTPVGAAVARLDRVGSLPTFSFYFEGEELLRFEGDNVDKLRAVVQAAQLRRLKILQDRQRAADEAAKLAAMQAA
jgi:thiol-disulfide isomerase/thioredoxin